MKLSRLCHLVLFAVFGVANAALGQENLVVATATATAFDNVNKMSGGNIVHDIGITDEAFAINVAPAVINSGGVSAAADAKGRANYGNLGVAARASVIGGSDPFANGGRAKAQVDASFQDIIVVTVPTLPRGSTITLRVPLTVSGSLFRVATTQPAMMRPPSPVTIGPFGGFASGSLGIAPINLLLSTEFSGLPIPGTLSFAVTAPLLNIDTNISAPDLFTADIKMPNDIGNRIGFTLTLLAEDSAQGTTLAQIEGFYFGSLHWGGIESVIDSSGNVIPQDQWTITSASGFDYSKPFVPEPSSIFLLATALYGLSWFRKNEVVRNQFREN
jgi:hypothetical protein